MGISFVRGQGSRPHFAPHSLALVCAAVAFCALSAWPARGYAQEAAPVAPEAPAGQVRPARVIEINGTIRATLVDKLRSALAPVDPDRFPAGVVILLNSPGGDGLAAMEAGRLARAAKAHVFVRGKCASACVFILAAGVVRGAPEGVVGIHRARLTTFVKGIGVVDINTASNPNAARVLEAGDRRTEDYLREMGMPDTLFQAMKGTPSDQTRLLTAPELVEFGLNGVDPAYLEVRTPGAVAGYRMAATDFAPRSMLVQGRCAAENTPAREFIRCYSRVLRTGE